MASQLLRDPLSKTQLGRKRIDEQLVDALRMHAPDVLALEPGAHWSRATEELIVVSAVGRDAAIADVRRVRRAIARLLAAGRERGCWQWAGSLAPLAARAEPDRFTRVTREYAELARQRCDVLLAKQLSVLTCGDTTVLRGALMIAAADLSAVLVPQLLTCIPQLFDDHTFPVKAGTRVSWINIPLGGATPLAGKPGRKRPAWNSSRRWILNDVSLRIACALKVLPRGQPATADECLRACARFLELPVLSVDALHRTAAARWALELDEASFRYATTMYFAPSLPDPVFESLLSGEARRVQPTPVGRDRKATAGLEEDGNEVDSYGPEVETEFGEPLMEYQIPSATNGDLESQLIAAAALKRVFGAFIGKKKAIPSRSVLLERLETWNTRYRTTSGWVGLMADWARAALDASYCAGSARRLSWKTIHRYLTGFAKPFVLAVGHVAPVDIMDGRDEAQDAFADGFERLRDQLAARGAASTDKEGLRQWLHFVHFVGGPSIQLDSSWAMVVSARDADANLLTEREYARVLAWLERKAPAGTYPCARARVMTILAFRLGLRWEELQTRRLCDVQLSDTEAVIWVRRNAYFHGKSRSAIRKIPLAALLTSREMEELRNYLTLARGLSPGLHAQHMLFADPADTERPPEAETTHAWIVDAMRDVTGDPTVVFHHLRHSAASHLFAKLMAAPGTPWPIADWRESKPRARSDHSDLARRMTGRLSTDAARLFAISRLLGHADPMTSMRYYIHLADLVLAATVHRERPGAAAAVAVLDGVQPHAIYRERARARARVRQREHHEQYADQ